MQDLTPARFRASFLLSDDAEKPPEPKLRRLLLISGDDLLSHTVSRVVPSALEGLTSVFGMGTGVTPPL